MKFIDVLQLIFAARHDGWDAGYAAGKQEVEFNSGITYWDGFTEGLVQGKLEAELKHEEEGLIKGLRKIFGG